MTDLFQIQGRVNMETGSVDQAEARVSQFASAVSGKGHPINLDTRQAVTQVNQLDRLRDQMARQMGVAPRVKVDNSAAIASIKALETQVEQLHKKLAQTKMPALGGKAGYGGGGLSGFGQEMSGLGGGLIGGVLGGYGAEQIITSSISKAGFERRMQSTVMAGGFEGQGAAVIKWMDELGKATGYMNDDLLQSVAAIDDVTAANGLSAASMQQLTKLATGIAATTPLPQYMDNVLSSSEALLRGLNGQDKGLKILGIRTNDAYMKTTYLNGALAGTWDQMSDAAKMQERYKAIMSETTGVIDGAITGGDEYARSAREAAKAIEEAKEALGNKMIPVVIWLTKLLKEIPTPVLAGGLGLAGAAGIAAGAGAGIWGGGQLAKAGRGILGRGAGKAIVEAAAEGVAEEVAEAGARNAGKVLKTGGARGLLAKAAGAIPGVGGIASAGLLGAAVAAPLALGAGIAVNEQKLAEKGNVQKGYIQNQALLGRLYREALMGGKQYGVYTNDKGYFVQGEANLPTGSDRQGYGAMAHDKLFHPERYSTLGYSTQEAIAAYGGTLGVGGAAAAAAGEATMPPVNVTVQIVNQTGGPIQALPPVTNPGSYAPSSQ